MHIFKNYKWYTPEDAPAPAGRWSGPHTEYQEPPSSTEGWELYAEHSGHWRVDGDSIILSIRKEDGTPFVETMENSIVIAGIWRYDARYIGECADDDECYFEPEQ